jgi:hypothetical protein
MRRTLSLGRLFPRAGVVLSVIAVLFLATVWVSCSTDIGACVGTGGVLSSPDCKTGWTRAECTDWNNQGIDDANWSFYAGQTCADLGYPST